MLLEETLVRPLPLVGDFAMMIALGVIDNVTYRLLTLFFRLGRDGRHPAGPRRMGQAGAHRVRAHDGDPDQDLIRRPSGGQRISIASPYE
mgnify:CR=1 FL=1